MTGQATDAERTEGRMARSSEGLLLITGDHAATPCAPLSPTSSLTSGWLSMMR